MKTGPFSLFIILITLLSAFLNFNHCSTSSDPPDYHNGKKFGYLKGFIKDIDTGLLITGSIVMLPDNIVSDNIDSDKADTFKA